MRIHTMNRYFYKSTLSHFATADQAVILGQMAAVNSFDLTPNSVMRGWNRLQSLRKA